MVIPPARTGRDNSNNTAVTKMAQPNKGTYVTLVLAFPYL